MTVNIGQQNTYVNTEPQKRVIADRIVMAEPMEYPLMKALSMDENKFKFVNAPGKKYEWQEDTYAPLSDTANEADLASDSTTTVMTVAHGEYFHVGDIIQIDDEYIYVSSISGDEVTVVRDHGGTQATHAATSTIYIRSQARIEGADASDSNSTDVTTGYNYSFILHENVEISRSDERLKRYGIPSLVEYGIDKKMAELMRHLTRKPYFGTRAAGSATTGRDCGGFDTFISTNTYAKSSVRLARSFLDDANRDIYNYGGVAKLMVCGAFQQQLISDIFEGFITTERSEQMGGVTIKRIQMALGNVVDVLVDRYCPAGSIYLLDTDYVGFIPIDPFFYEDLGKVGDTAAYGQIIGEYGFVVQAENHHAKISGLATS